VEGALIWLPFRIKTMLDNYPGLPHFFWIFPEIQAGELFRENTVKGVRFILRG
jgi:versiconal hemiacetal acetate esterase